MGKKAPCRRRSCCRFSTLWVCLLIGIARKTGRGPTASASCFQGTARLLVRSYQISGNVRASFHRVHGNTAIQIYVIYVKMKLYSIVSVILAVCTQAAVANVEKTIFIAPSALTIPLDHPTFENLHLQTLSPENSTIRTQLHSGFPSDIFPRGPASWFILSDLTEGQRYEVRICWPATVRNQLRSPHYTTTLANSNTPETDFLPSRNIRSS